METLVGQKFGYWKVIRFSHYRKTTGRYWVCRCRCGTTRAVMEYTLKRRPHCSCGCYQKQRASAANKTHGLSKSKEFNIWCCMKERCYRTNTRAYKWYGGRGIRVCDRWLSSFANFYKDMGPRPTSRHTINRIDNDGDYSPDNCCWATYTEQARNTRQTTMITYKGETKSISEWAEIMGISSDNVKTRLKLGWTVEESLQIKPNKSHKIKSLRNLIEYNGEFKTKTQWAEYAGISIQCLVFRLKSGWSLHDAITTKPNLANKFLRNKL